MYENHGWKEMTEQVSATGESIGRLDRILREYRLEQYMSSLEESGVDEVHCRIRIPNITGIGTIMYTPHYNIEIGPYYGEPDDAVFEPDRPDDLLDRLVAVREYLASKLPFTKPRTFETSIYGKRPREAYGRAMRTKEQWQDTLEQRGFTVHGDMEIPRGLAGQMERLRDQYGT